MKICPVGAKLLHAGGWMDRWTDRQTARLTVVPRNLANAPNKMTSYQPSSGVMTLMTMSKTTGTADSCNFIFFALHKLGIAYQFTFKFFIYFQKMVLYNLPVQHVSRKDDHY